jgi:hypothetical protein
VQQFAEVVRETTREVQRLTYSVYAEEIYGEVVLYIII